jgi:hypothetical protein
MTFAAASLMVIDRFLHDALGASEGPCCNRLVLLILAVSIRRIDPQIDGC